MAATVPHSHSMILLPSEQKTIGLRLGLLYSIYEVYGKDEGEDETYPQVYLDSKAPFTNAKVDRISCAVIRGNSPPPAPIEKSASSTDLCISTYGRIGRRYNQIRSFTDTSYKEEEVWQMAEIVESIHLAIERAKLQPKKLPDTTWYLKRMVKSQAPNSLIVSMHCQQIHIILKGKDAKRQKNEDVTVSSRVISLPFDSALPPQLSSKTVNAVPSLEKVTRLSDEIHQLEKTCRLEETRPPEVARLSKEIQRLEEARQVEVAPLLKEIDQSKQKLLEFGRDKMIGKGRDGTAIELFSYASLKKGCIVPKALFLERVRT